MRTLFFAISSLVFISTIHGDGSHLIESVTCYRDRMEIQFTSGTEFTNFTAPLDSSQVGCFLPNVTTLTPDPNYSLPGFFPCTNASAFNPGAGLLVASFSECDLNATTLFGANGTILDYRIQGDFIAYVDPLLNITSCWTDLPTFPWYFHITCDFTSTVQVTSGTVNVNGSASIPDESHSGEVDNGLNGGIIDQTGRPVTDILSNQPVTYDLIMVAPTSSGTTQIPPALAMIPKECWFSDSPSILRPFGGANVVTFVQSSCPKAAQTSVFDRMKKKSDLEYSIDFFGFTFASGVDQTIYVHCTVSLCYTAVDSVCQKPCWDSSAAPSFLREIFSRPSRTVSQTSAYMVRKQQVSDPSGNSSWNLYIVLGVLFSLMVLIIALTVCLFVTVSRRRRKEQVHPQQSMYYIDQFKIPRPFTINGVVHSKKF